MVDVFLEGISKYFGNVKAVEDLTLKIEDEEFLTLLGPSGCGKTTTLRLIAGLEHPNKGNIYIGGQLVNDLPPKDRNVAMVFQSYALYPHMNVFDNIAFPLKIRGLPKEEIRRRVKETAELLDISTLLERKPKELSGGQKQRVALGRAIIRQPQVFLLDEPLANLDAKLRLYMRVELKKLQKSLGITTIYVTHDQVEAMSMSDRIAVMNNGKLQQVGDPSQIYMRPSNVWVAGFIGNPPMNFFDCNLIERNGKYFLEGTDFLFPIKEETAAHIRKISSSSSLTIGVRPENVLIEKKPKASSIPAEVYIIEPLGDSLIINLKIGSTLIKVRARGDFLAKTGDRVYLTFQEDDMHVFDKKDGKALL